MHTTTTTDNMGAADIVLNTQELVECIIDQLPEIYVPGLLTVNPGVMYNIARRRWPNHMSYENFFARVGGTGREQFYATLLNKMFCGTWYDPEATAGVTFPNVVSLELTGNVHPDLIASFETLFPRLVELRIDHWLCSMAQMYDFLMTVPVKSFVSQLYLPGTGLCEFFKSLASNKSIEVIHFLAVDDTWLQSAIDVGSFQVRCFEAMWVDTKLTGEVLLKALPNMTQLRIPRLSSETRIEDLSLEKLTAHEPVFEYLEIVIAQPSPVTALEMVNFVHKHHRLEMLDLTHAGQNLSTGIFEPVDNKRFFELLPQLKVLRLQVDGFDDCQMIMRIGCACRQLQTLVLGDLISKPGKLPSFWDPLKEQLTVPLFPCLTLVQWHDVYDHKYMDKEMWAKHFPLHPKRRA